MSFVHLHVHSHYSLLDGLSRIEKLVETAVKFGMPALSLTDHGVMYGAIEFYNCARDAGLKPIIGMEAYIAPRGMEDKDGKTDADYFHLTLLAQSYEGYLNLMRLSSEAHLRGFYYKPRLDKETLAKYSSGIVALSGCPRGELFRASSSGKLERAKQVLKEYQQIFGTDNFYIELQRTERDKTGEDALKFAKTTDLLIELSKQTGAPLVATADSHYIHSEDYEAQDVLVCIGTGRTVMESNRLDMRSGDLSLKSPEEMQEIFSDIPEALENTLRIAERCEVEIPTNQRYFAKVEIPETETYETYLRKQVFSSAEKIYRTPLPTNVTERLEYELEIICQKGFAPYFLMVAEIAEGARGLGAVVTTRGSAAGSLVGYVLNISTIDPLYFQLPFERFLNPFRPTPPDIDLDISDSGRDAAIAWITDKYGKDKVAQIITFGTMQARASVRDVGRALGISYGKCDRLAKLIPIGKQGFNMTLKKALDISPELKGAYEMDPEARQILDVALKLEGGARHASIHAAALAITPTPLTDYTPLQKEPDGERVITQYDMYSLDVGADGKAIGVVKMDLLGIRNLSILASAVRLVEERHGIKLDIYKLPHPDPKTFELLSKGLTFGVFQLGSGGMTKNLKELQPTSIFDIMAMVALYRPGPMAIIPEYIARKRDSSKVQFFLPQMKDYMERSLGLLVYQDDVLLTAINIAGYTWEEADKFRKAMGKKLPEEMAKQKAKFITGCGTVSGLSPERAEELFAQIEPFAAYGFGKAHAASYAQVGYQTAYVKAHFPVEYMASLMSAESNDETKIYEAVEECKVMGIRVLPPDVYESDEDFTVVDEKTIRFGLGAVKNLGSDLIAHLLALKQNLQLHARLKTDSNLSDFVTECASSRGFNKRSWEALAKAGALDRFDTRGRLLGNTESILSFAKEHQKDATSPQDSLFGLSSFSQLRLSEFPDLEKSQALAYEKEHLGLYVTGHPLDQYSKALSLKPKLKTVLEEPDGTKVVACGLVATMKKMLTKKQEMMAVFTLEDPSGKVEVLVFPKVLPLVVDRLLADTALKVHARISANEGEVKLVADELELLIADKDRKTITVVVSPTAKPESFLRIKQILEQFPGEDEVIVQIGQEADAKKLFIKSPVNGTLSLVRSLKNVADVVDILA